MRTSQDIDHTTYIKASPEEIYKMLTTGEGWDAWFTAGTTVDPRPGGKIQLRWKNFGAGRWTMEDGGPVLEAERNHKFTFQWSPGSSPTKVSFTLNKLGPGTLLQITESGYSLTDSDIAVCVDSAVGWGEALTLLKFYLEHKLTYGKVPFAEE